MNIKDIQLFITMSEEKNLTRTAEVTGYTQSGISHILKNLEKEMGFSLFVRTKKGIYLTPNGELVLPYARNLISSNESMGQMISSINGIQDGHISIGAFTSISIEWLPLIIEKFKNDYPNIVLEIREGGFQDIENWIENGTVDFGMYSHTSKKNFEWIPLKEDPMLAVLPGNFPIEDKKSFSIHELEKFPFIMLDKEADYDVHEFLNANDIHPDICFSSANDHAILSMVEHHLGISILPELILKNSSRDIKTLPLNPLVTRTLGIYLLSKNSISPAALKFITYAKNLITKN